MPARATAAPPASPVQSLAALADVKVKVAVVLGRTQVTFDEAVRLEARSVLTMDRTGADPVEVCVNGKAVARGKLVVVGESYGVQITELVEEGPAAR
ncbi:MAG: FliM/FliN family flagellar motor switch protein [Gemmatimonadota bacterium]